MQDAAASSSSGAGLYLVTSDALMELSIQNEAKDVWRMYLDYQVGWGVTSDWLPGRSDRDCASSHQGAHQRI